MNEQQTLKDVKFGKSSGGEESCRTIVAQVQACKSMTFVGI